MKLIIILLLGSIIAMYPYILAKVVWYVFFDENMDKWLK